MKQLIISILLYGFLCAQSVSPVLDGLSNYPNMRDFTVSSTKDEAYVTMQTPMQDISVILELENESGKWINPQVASFSGVYDDLEPFLSPDNLKLYFVSNRPFDQVSKKTKDYDIWVVERVSINTNWSTPINLGKPINTSHDEFYPSVAFNGNLYFTSNAPMSRGKDDIFFSKWNGNAYEPVVTLSKSINTLGYEFNAYIAPDESYLLFTAYKRKDGFGSGDLYISHQKNGKWSLSKNLGKAINSKSMDYCPFVDAKTGLMYFTSKRNEIKRKPFKSINDVLDIVNSYSNGLSRIYKSSIQTILKK